MKIFIGEIPEIKDPCDDCDADCDTRHSEYDDGESPTCPAVIDYRAKQSILNQCKEVDLDNKYVAYRVYVDAQIRKGEPIEYFSQFIQEQLKGLKGDVK